MAFVLGFFPPCSWFQTHGVNNKIILDIFYISVLISGGRGGGGFGVKPQGKKIKFDD